MKPIILSISVMTLLAGTASANDLNWPCTNLTANWNQAPHQQCGRIVGNGSQPVDRQTYVAPVVEEPVVEDDRAA